MTLYKNKTINYWIYDEIKKIIKLKIKLHKRKKTNSIFDNENYKN